MRIFCGYDEREAIGYETFAASVQRRASKPVHLFRLDACGLPVGSNAFTLSRFLVPELCCWSGWAVYADASDMLCLADITELDALRDDRYAVRVVKHSYRTRHPVKYVGTEMECPNLDYARKNWASLMLINCAHMGWRTITRQSLTEARIRPILQFDMLMPGEIGELPDEWNRLVDEGQPVEGARILHWTAGIPAFEHYRSAPGADLWRIERAHDEREATPD
jgi:hypothetical protein